MSATFENPVPGQTLHGVGAPALIVDNGDHVYEDCRFTAESWSQIVVVRGGSVTFRRCRFEAGTNRGLTAEGGRVTVEDCEFVGNRVGFWATNAADANLRRCRISGPGSAGMFFQKRATGRVEDCAVRGVDDGAVVIRSGATPIFVGCTFAAANVAVHYEDGGAGEMHDCVILGGVQGVCVREGGAPRLVDCRIENATCVGIGLMGGGRFERCRLEGNSIGILLQTGSDPVFVDCDANGGLSLGLCAMDGARGRIEGCRFGPHPIAPTMLQPGAQTVLVEL